MNHTNNVVRFHLKPSLARRWAMWVIAAIFFCYENFLQISLNVMNDDLRHAFHLSAEQMGHLGAWYFYAYALMQIPVGSLIDRYGVKPLLSSAVLVCALGTLVFGSAQSFSVACLGRFLIGFGSAFAVVACMQIAAVWLPSKRFALITGATLMLGMLGAAGAQVPLHALLGVMGWRHTMFLFAGLGVLIALTTVLVLIDKPTADASKTPLIDTRAWLAGMRKALSNKQVWLITVYAALVFVVTPVFGGLWGASFLIHTAKVTEAEAAHMVQYLFIGWAIGAPLFGWLSDRMQRRLPPMYLGAVGTLVVLLVLLYGTVSSTLVYMLLLFVMGFLSSAFLPAFSLVRDICAPSYRATSMGFVNTLNMVAPALANPFVGWMLDQHWRGGLLHGIRTYDAHAYHTAILVLPVCVGLSLCILPWIKEGASRLHHITSNKQAVS